MPYLNSLAAQHSLAANYSGNIHPSIGNYLMLTTGQIETIDDNFTGSIADDNVVRALTGAGKTWKATWKACLQLDIWARTSILISNITIRSLS